MFFPFFSIIFRPVWLLCASLPFWILWVFFDVIWAMFVFFLPPAYYLIVPTLSKGACKQRANIALEATGNPMSDRERQHFLSYANYYFFPTTTMQLSMMYSIVGYILLLTCAVFLISEEKILPAVISGIAAFPFFTFSARVSLSPHHEKQNRGYHSPTSRRKWRFEDEVIAVSLRVKAILAEYSELVGGDLFWRQGQELILSQYHRLGFNAHYQIGFALEKGFAVEQNIPLSIEFYKKAAEQGFADAHFRLASIYISGPESIRDVDKSIEWCTLAANYGHREAKEALKVYYEA